MIWEAVGLSDEQYDSIDTRPDVRHSEGPLRLQLRRGFDIRLASSSCGEQDEYIVRKETHVTVLRCSAGDSIQKSASDAA
jgi:hypothetical protein